MRCRVRVAGAVLALVAAVLANPSRAQDEGGWIAVVVAADSADRFDARELALVYRRKKVFAEDGTRLTPVNLPADHPLRRRFSRAVLGQSPEALEPYWNQQYFQGVLPPHVLGSEEAVMRFVAVTPHAVGYLGACHRDATLRTVLLVDPEGSLRGPEQSPPCTGG